MALLAASIDPTKGLASNLGLVVEALKKIAVYSQIFVWEKLCKVPSNGVIVLGDTLPTVIGRIDSTKINTKSIEIITGNTFEQDGHMIVPIVHLGYLVSVLIYRKEDLSPNSESLMLLLHKLLSIQWGTNVLTSVAYMGKSQENNVLSHKYSIDELTGLYNRARLMEDAPTFNPLHIGMIDLNKFKFVNDTYGHEAGDKVLKELAIVLNKYQTRDVVPYRQGGDEFVVLSNDIDLIRDYTQLISDELSTRIIRLKSSTGSAVIDYKVSISMGVVLNCPSLKAGMALADSIMYEAKRSGNSLIRVNETIYNIGG